MELRLTFARDAGRQALYTFPDWRLEGEDAHGFTYRPTGRTLLLRLAGSMACAVAVVLLQGAVRHVGWTLTRIPDWTQTASVARFAAFWVCQGGSGGAVALAVLLPLSCLWQRIHVWVSARSELCIHSVVVVPRTRSWPISSFNDLLPLAQQRRAGRGALREIGWLWRVILQGQDGYVEFRPAFQRNRPSGQGLPPQVAAFVGQMQRLTGLTCQAPSVQESGPGKRVSFPTGRRVRAGAGPFVERRVYRQGDEMPPEVVARVEQLQRRKEAEGRTSGEATFKESRFTLQNADGTVRTYGSMDEMPPEVRRLFERMQQEARHGKE